MAFDYCGRARFRSERGSRYYRMQVDNEGGIVMPLHLGITY